MIRRCVSYNVIQLVNMVYDNYKKYKSYNDLSGLDMKQCRTTYVSLSQICVCSNTLTSTI
jgi:hypothetical protein